MPNHKENLKLFLRSFIILVLLLLPVSSINHWMNVNLLPFCHNQTFKQEISEVLDEFNYIFPYRADRFDCYETSIFAMKILRDRGYDPLLMERSPWPGYNKGHLWVAIPSNRYNELDDLGTWAMKNTWVMIETTADMHEKLGTIVQSDEYRNGTLVYDVTDFLHENETTLVWYVLNENPYDFVKQRSIEPL